MKILITGGTNGIGLSFVKKYNRNHDITLICRDKIKGNALLEMYPNIHVLYCDLSNYRDVFNLMTKLNVKYDIFVNNAGISCSRKILECNGRNINRCQMVNLISPYLLINHLLQNTLVDKIITINSMTHWYGKIPYIGESFKESYANSKLALMSLHTYWNTKYEKVVFISLNPGYVDTGIWHPNSFGESIHKYIRFVFALQPHEMLYLFDSAFEYNGTEHIYYSTNSESRLFSYLSENISNQFMLCNDFLGKTLYKTNFSETIHPSPYSQLPTTIDIVERFCSQFL